MGKACILRFCWLFFLLALFPSELIIFVGNVQHIYKENSFIIVQFCVNGMPARFLFLHAHLAVKGVFTLFTLSKCFLCLPKPSGRMYAHIGTYAAHPILTQIIPSVDESSAHKLPSWYLVTPGAGTGQSSSQN